MSVDVALHELAETVARYGFAYVLTVGADARAHVVAVTPVVEDGELRVAEPGRTTRRNIDGRPAVTLVWPPAEHGDYSLIVDGQGSLRGDALAVTPARAVLHRPAPSVSSPASGCGADCIELPVDR